MLCRVEQRRIDGFLKKTKQKNVVIGQIISLIDGPLVLPVLTSKQIFWISQYLTPCLGA